MVGLEMFLKKPAESVTSDQGLDVKGLRISQGNI